VLGPSISFPSSRRRDVTEPCAGKRVGLLTVYFQQVYEGKTYRFRRVMRAAERTIDRKGQLLLMP